MYAAIRLLRQCVAQTPFDESQGVKKWPKQKPLAPANQRPRRNFYTCPTAATAMLISFRLRTWKQKSGSALMNCTNNEDALRGRTNKTGSLPSAKCWRAATIGSTRLELSFVSTSRLA